jgi:hypothetical protein
VAADPEAIRQDAVPGIAQQIIITEDGARKRPLILTPVTAAQVNHQAGATEVHQAGRMTMPPGVLQDSDQAEATGAADSPVAGSAADPGHLLQVRGEEEIN